MRVKEIVKLKFKTMQDWQVVKNMAAGLRVDLNEYTMRAVFAYTNALIEQIQNKQKEQEANSGSTSSESIGAEGGQPTSEATGSAALAEPNNSTASAT